MKHWLAFFCVFFLLSPSLALAEEKPQARILIGLYDSHWESSPRTSHIHRFLEMPANHLGFDIQYYDVNEPLPKLGDNVAGIVAWFNSGIEVPDALTYLSWLDDALKHGKKFLAIENAGIGESYRKNAKVMQRWNDVLTHIGLHDDNTWNDITYHADLEHIDNEMVGFERKVGPLLPPFVGTHAIAGMATSYLRIHLKDNAQDKHYDLITTSPQGGYIAEGYALIYVKKKKWSDITQWYVNPFLFLKKALDVGLSPTPDVTTLDGRRIFYSHIDGDGWNNVSEIPEYQRKIMISAEVVDKEILQSYSDFPFTVGLIAADVDPDCYATHDSERVAKDIFALPNVEPSSHTYTHPLFWKFFEYYTPDMEKPLLDRYPPKPAKSVSLMESIRKNLTINEGSAPDPADKTDIMLTPAADAVIKRGRNDESVEDELRKYYHTPRSYYCSHFNLEQEITGSIKRVDDLVPPGKKAGLLQWSGDTSPFEAALAMARQAGLLNLNGGLSRFDDEHPSYSFVAPIGLKVGQERQIYASSSNENTYTDLWTNRFFGYRYLKVTAERTENPIRVLPFNIYFHIFSGQKEASLNAIKENLDFARTQDIIPITASHYAAIANGFYSTEITRIGNMAWRIRNRGDMETFRFDGAANFSVDLASSKGILGQRYFQNNLYVAFDPAAEEAIISLKANNHANALPPEKIPYLIESTWNIKNVQSNAQGLTFDTQGFGHGIMRWSVPESGEYIVQAKGKQDDSAPLFENHIMVTDDHLLTINLDDVPALEQMSVIIRAVSLKQS